MKVGLFGGTFDPIHLGHLGAAIYAREMCRLDEIWFVPAAQSPLKLDRKSAPEQHRKAMVEHAIAEIPGLALCDIELQRPPPSYTIDTLRELKERFEHQLSLVVSDDVAETLPHWQAVEELLSLVPLIVTRRTSFNKPPVTGHAAADAAIVHGYIEAPIIQISATTIRKRLRQGLPCQHLVTESVLAYIDTHHLYSVG